MKRTVLVALGAFVIGVLVGVASVSRYQLVGTNTGTVYRMDKLTGEVMFCAGRKCWAAEGL